MGTSAVRFHEVAFRYRVLFWLTLIGSLPALARGLAFWRERKRAKTGFCPTCGYDLRASPERCPECGTVRLRF
jgi:hypothetical protein